MLIYTPTPEGDVALAVDRMVHEVVLADRARFIEGDQEKADRHRKRADEWRGIVAVLRRLA